MIIRFKDWAGTGDRAPRVPRRRSVQNVLKYLCSIMIPCPRLDILDSSGFLVYIQHQSLLVQHFMRPRAVHFVIYLLIIMIQIDICIFLKYHSYRQYPVFGWNIGENYYEHYYYFKCAFTAPRPFFYNGNRILKFSSHLTYIWLQTAAHASKVILILLSRKRSDFLD